MADYQGKIRLAVEGLPQLNRLNSALERATELLGSLENAQVYAGQIGESATRNVNSAVERRRRAQASLTRAQQTVANTAMRRDPATGRIMGGGPNATARRLAGRQLRLAQRELREADRNLGQEIQNRQVIDAAERRYARALDRTTAVIGRTQGSIKEQQARINQAMRGIGQGSRGNYLTNLFQGRLAEFARGGGGAKLPVALQEQARNVRAAWDVATAGGRENLRLMSRLATEMAGLTRQQNELNRSQTNRSGSFEVGRRGQERITDLSRMPGADPAKIRRLRSQATAVISAGYTGDQATTQLATRRLNASINRYKRELDAAAQELNRQRRTSFRNFNVRQNWTAILAEEQERIRAAQQAANDLYNRDRALSRDFGVNPAMALRPAGMSDEQVARRNLISTRTAAAAEQSAFNAFSRQANEINADMPTLRSIRRNQEKRAKAEARLAAIAEAEAKAREALLARIQKNIDLSQAGREVSNFGFGLAGDPVAKSIRRNQEKRAVAEARLAAIAEAEAAAREALFARIQKNIDLSQASRQASNFGLGFAGDPIAKSIRRNQEKRAIAEAKLAAIAEAEAAARAALFARVQKNIDLSQAGREASNFGLGLAGDAVAKSIRRNQEKRAKAEARLAAIAEAEAQAREVLFARVQKNIDLSQAGRQASNFGFGSADDAVAKSIRRNREKTAQATAREAAAAAISANQSSTRGRGAELRRTGGLSFEERLAAIRPDLAPSAAKPAPGFFRGSARKAIGEGLIGGAFPLLFGQGAGASAGGLAGGLAGGAIGGSFGFGLSLVGTAIGQAVDTTAQNLKDLAASLKSPNDTMAALEASGFRVGDSLKFQVGQLQSVGRAYDAQTLVLQEVQKRLGPGSLTELTELDKAQKRLQESWAAIGAEIQTRLLPVLQGFLEFLGSAAGDIGGFASQSRLQRLDSETFGRLRDQAIKETSGPLGMFGDKKAYDARLNELARQELSGRFQNERAKVPPSPQEAFAAEVTRIEESYRIADQVRSAYREAFSLQRQAHDLQRDGAELNRDVADYIYKKGREIFDLQQRIAEQSIENNRAATQNRIESGDLDARQTFAAAVGFEQQLLTNVREVMRTRMEGEADIEQSRKKLELTMAKLNRDIEDYKRTTAREIEDIERRKLSYVRSVEDYKMRVADYVRDRARESARLMQQAMTLPNMSGAGGGAIGGGLATAIDRIGGAYQFRSRDTSSSYINRLGFSAIYQSDQRENKFFDQRPALIAGAKSRIASLTQSDMAALAFTVLTEAGPTDIGKMDVAANILLRSANLGNAPISAVAKQPGQYEGVFSYSRNQIEDPAFGRQRFGSRYDQTLNLLRGGMSAPATMGGAARLPGSISGRLDASGQNGADMPVGPNNEIRSYHTGVVTEISRAGNNGNYAVVQFMDDLGNRLEATYSHMAAIVKVGQQVTGGQVLGRYDASGNTSGPHNSIDINSPGTNGALQRNAETAAARRSADILVTGRVQGSNAPQAMAAMTISNIPQPRFNATPLGPTPSAAPINASREALERTLGVTQQEAQRILEDQIKLKQKGISLGQMEQILQANQLPQLRQQADELQRQIDARSQNLSLSNEDASIADIRAQGEARIAGLLEERRKALEQVQKQYPGDLSAIKQINEQSAHAIAIAKGEEDERLKIADLSNRQQDSERARTEILQLQEALQTEKAQAAALERGELEASAVKLLEASMLYERSSDAQRARLKGLTAETEELRKQNELNREIGRLRRESKFAGAGSAAGFAGEIARVFEEALINDRSVEEATALAREAQSAAFGKELDQLRQQRQFVGAGLRAGLAGEQSRTFEQALLSGKSTEQATRLAQEARLLEDQQLLWGGLERNIVDVSNAISGGLTNGLLDIVSGARKIEDVGKEVLDSIARTFADTAQQQLTTLLQRQLAGLLGGSGGPLTKLFGAGPGAMGQQAVAASASAASASLWGLQGAAVALATTFQSMAAQSALSGAMGGGSVIPDLAGGLVGSLFSPGAPGFFSPNLIDFGGFLANGGTTRPGEGYVVGEKEPEFFFPGITGRVVPRSDMEKAEELRAQGGQLDEIDIRYTVTEQRGERYITEAQFRKSNAALLQKAQAITYSGMRNNREVRDFVNI